MKPCIGCAGWAINKPASLQFPGAGTHLQRYARQLTAVEINSSFYKPHREATYARWADSTPGDFRFSVKMPKAITHEKSLRGVDLDLDRFCSEIRGLGPKLGLILVQLPPRFKWDLPTADDFFSRLRARLTTPIACEPRHRTWSGPAVDSIFNRHGISRVRADPEIVPADPAAEPASSLCYFRLHGSPRVYYSAYDDAYLSNLAARINSLLARQINVWCIFDNTALCAATENALTLARMLTTHMA